VPNPLDIPPDQFVTLDDVRFHFLDWGGDGDPEGSAEPASPDRFASYDDYVDFVLSVLPDGVWGPALDAMLRTSVDTHADGSVVDKLSDATFAPFVQALNAFRHPYSDITAPALAIYALEDTWRGAEATWRAACRDRFAAETAYGRVVEIRAGHYLFLDRRDDVLAAVREFLP
jgi:pimeloyl-ACP methyl ester carboxylesterase